MTRVTITKLKAGETKMTTANAHWDVFHQDTRKAMRSAREALNVTHAHKAVGIGVSKIYIRHIEAGRCLPSSRVIVNIGKFLYLKPAELFVELSGES